MIELKFHTQFTDAVRYGEKRQTARKGDREWSCGDTVRLLTEGDEEIGEAVVMRTAKIRIEATEMFVNGSRLPSIIYSRDQIEPTDNEFAEADGFEGFMEMAEWFEGKYGLPFEGTVVYWGEIR